MLRRPVVAAAFTLLVCLAPAGAQGTPGAPPGGRAEAGVADRADGADRPDRGCDPGGLPSVAPDRGTRETAARAVVACMSAAVQDSGAARDGATLRGATLTVAGLYCPPATDTCQAVSIDLRTPRIRYSGGAGASCMTAERITLSGAVRFRASRLRGRVFGVLPVTLSSRTVPPVPVPYLELEGVVAHGLWTSAGRVEATATSIGPGSACESVPRHHADTASVGT